MRENKNRLLLVVVIVLASAAIYFGPGRHEPTTVEKMLDARADHDHGNALIYANQLLTSDPSNHAAKKVIKESGQIFYYLRAAKTTLAESRSSNDNEIANPETLYDVFNTASGYVSKAKALDPKFEKSLTFEKALGEAQTALIYMLAMNVNEVGKNTFSTAMEKYEKSAEFIDAAASSGYMSRLLSVQSAWAATRVPFDEDGETITEALDKMEETEQLISASNVQSVQNFVDSLTEYIQVTRSSIDTLLVPTGTFNDYTKAAEKASEAYETAQENLQDAMPRSASMQESYANLVGDSEEFKVLENTSITKILEENESIYTQ